MPTTFLWWKWTRPGTVGMSRTYLGAEAGAAAQGDVVVAKSTGEELRVLDARDEWVIAQRSLEDPLSKDETFSLKVVN